MTSGCGLHVTNAALTQLASKRRAVNADGESDSR